MSTHLKYLEINLDFFFYKNVFEHKYNCNKNIDKNSQTLKNCCVKNL